MFQKKLTLTQSVYLLRNKDMKVVFFGLEMTWKYLSLIKEELFKIRTTMLLILFKEIACDCIFFTLYRKTSSICSAFKDRKMFKNRRVLWIF